MTAGWHCKAQRPSVVAERPSLKLNSQMEDMSENQEHGTTQPELVKPITLTPEEHSRFWSKVNKNGPIHSTNPNLGCCWIWIAGSWGRGYGAFSFRGSQIKSHRLSYLTERGPIHESTPFVLHSCDVRLCCNPSHLFLGTYADNSNDMCSKGRHRTATGDDHYLRLNPERILSGSDLPHSKLTETIVEEIRATKFSSRFTQHDLAKQLHVTDGTISMILKRKTWKHVK